MNHKHLLTFVAVGLAGCSVTPAPDEAQARTRLVGMSPAQVESCMGQPPIKTQLTVNGPMTWVYSYGANAASVSTPGDLGQANFGYATFSGGPNGSAGAMFQSALAAPARSLCNVRVIFDQANVSQVQFVGPNGADLAQSVECGSLVQACMP